MKARALLPHLFCILAISSACSDSDKPAAIQAGGNGGGSGTPALGGADDESGGAGGAPALAGGAAGEAEAPEAGAAGSDATSSGGVPSICNQGKGAVVRGRVTSPNGELPLGGAAVYVPSTTVDALPFGTGCWRCDNALLGTPALVTLTDADGTFELDNVPPGEKVPLVVQTGKWRRQLELHVTDCEESALPEADTRLPSQRSEGDLPRIALVSGGEDTLECLLRKLGIDDSEFGGSFSDARVRLFQGKGGLSALSTDAKAVVQPADKLWTTPAPLGNFDLVLLGSESDQNLADKTSDALSAMHAYVASGGRLLVQHFQSYFLSAGPADFSSVAVFSPQPNLADPFRVKVDQTSERGEMLARALHAADPPSTLGELTIHAGRNGVASVQAPAVRLLYGEAPETVQAYSLDLAADAGQGACGRVTETELLTGSSDSVASFPDGCTTSGLSPQERALAYLIFDLGACLP